MDRAEKLAMEQYPVPKDNIFANSVRNAQRAAFQLGYLTAEQDLALTPGDMSIIDEICTEMRLHTDWPLKGQDAFYEEVLRRFFKKGRPKPPLQYMPSQSFAPSPKQPSQARSIVFLS